VVGRGSAQQYNIYLISNTNKWIAAAAAAAAAHQHTKIINNSR